MNNSVAVHLLISFSQIFPLRSMQHALVVLQYEETSSYNILIICKFVFSPFGCPEPSLHSPPPPLRAPVTVRVTISKCG